MTKSRVKRIEVFQTSLVSAIVFFFLSLVMIPMALIMGAVGGFADTPGFAFGGVLIIVMPIMYAVVGFLMTALSCWIYNMVAKRLGGIEIELEAIEE